MTQDASFKDGDERPLRLLARDAEDVAPLSALLQDAILTGNEMKWLAPQRKFAMYLNRFRWEDPARRAERVQAVLTISDVLKIRSSGIARDADTILSVLAMAWTPGQDGTGTLEITLAGDGAIQLEVECLEVTLSDVTRPYVAPSGQRPHHPE